MANGWTLYGKRQMFQLATTGQTPPALELSLWQGSANPDDPNNVPAELTLAGYERVGVIFQVSSDDLVVNTYDLEVGPITAAGNYQGVGIGDPDGLWFFTDDGGVVAIAANKTLLFPATSIQINRTS